MTTSKTYTVNFPVPAHIAMIMDGNGRWARERGLERAAGHVEGVNTVRRVTEAASQLGIKYLTLYAFSTENWNRPREEVNILMHLIVTAIERETPDLIKNNVRLSVIGDYSRVPADTMTRLNQCVADTAHCTGLNLILAISYSSRWEIVEASRRLAVLAVEGKITPESIDADILEKQLATTGIPDPDILIRTGGDMRVSNFLLWQIAYTELFVTQTYWPDFDGDQLVDIIKQFNTRQRRFGLTGEQAEALNNTSSRPSS
ncbi:MAG: isoprenyl transferase [Muribaculaceae bacterium]|nr:isoprenyl transferase [Muribaculaceae bacterium]